jgi:phytoene/squalene synthetase
MKDKSLTTQSLPAYITKLASKQTYYTFLLLADRDHLTDAYRSYAYFRWVDDVLDTKAGSIYKKFAFILRQKSLLDACYRGEVPNILCAEEWMLVDLVRNNPEINSGLHTYLHNMMEVMRFDAGRRGQVITQAELIEYSRLLASAVTEVLYYFISRDDPTPHNEARYLSVTAAHIIHMLRDTLEDIEAGYFNIPGEFIYSRGISPNDIDSSAYQEWVYERVHLAKQYFKAGNKYLSQVKSRRVRLAGYTYTARFEWVLRLIEHDNYHIRPAYSERKSLRAGMWMSLSTLSAVISSAKE